MTENEFQFDEPMSDDPGYDEEAKLVKDRLGFLPTSIWNVQKSRRWMELIRDWGDPTGKKRKDAKSGKEMDIKFSEFNPDVADRIIRLWSEKGDQIVDPFGGRATRAVVSGVLGRKYLGFEIAPKTQQLTLDRIKQVDEALNMSVLPTEWVEPEVRLADGVKMDGVPNGFADFILTCPPYFDVEKYESVPGQLSDFADYSQFIRAITPCFQRCFAILKSGKYMVWVVADMRRKGRLIKFHRDIELAAEAVGFHSHDEIIMQNRSPFARYVGNAVANRHTAKVHEYILVFRKP